MAMSKEELIDSHQHLWVMSEREYSWIEPSYGPLFDDLLFGINHIVWYLSQFMELFPGDVINTGTPFGVGLGFKPPVYLKVGDKIKTGIEGIGEISNTCVAASR